MPTEEMQMNVKLPAELIRRITVAAAASGLTKGRYVRGVLDSSVPPLPRSLSGKGGAGRRTSERRPAAPK